MDETQRALVELFPAAFASPVHGHEGVVPSPQNIRPKSVGLKEHRVLSTKSRMILSLEMRGHSKKQIAHQMGLSGQRLTQITNSDRYVAAREVLLGRMDHDFLAMKPAVFEALRNAITSRDENTALRGSEAWMRAAGFGQYGKGSSGQTGVTAEDVARQLLQVTVNVNVEK